MIHMFLSIVLCSYVCPEKRNVSLSFTVIMKVSIYKTNVISQPKLAIWISDVMMMWVKNLKVRTKKFTSSPIFLVAAPLISICTYFCQIWWFLNLLSRNCELSTQLHKYLILFLALNSIHSTFSPSHNLSSSSIIFSFNSSSPLFSIFVP